MTTIIEAMGESEAFGPWFEGESWAAWCAILKGAFALPMTPQELITFGELAGGRAPPKHRVRELWIAAGRRAGKDSIASLLAAHVAVIEQGHLGRLRPGEMASVLCLVVDRDQSRIVTNYIRAFFDAIPDLSAMVTRETRYGVELNNDIEITVATNSFRRSLRDDPNAITHSVSHDRRSSLRFEGVILSGVVSIVFPSRSAMRNSFWKANLSLWPR